MRRNTPRIPPLDQSAWSDEIAAQLAPLASSDGRADNVFTTMANHPKLMKRWMVFAGHILGKSTLPERERELVILRVGWNCQAGYEFAQHTVIGLRSGLTDDEIERLKIGADAPGWSDLDATLLRAVDELWSSCDIGDETWSALSEHLGTEQLMDLVFTVGQYQLVSMALNSFGVQLDDYLPRWSGADGLTD